MASFINLKGFISNGSPLYSSSQISLKRTISEKTSAICLPLAKVDSSKNLTLFLVCKANCKDTSQATFYLEQIWNKSLLSWSSDNLTLSSSPPYFIVS